MMNDTNRPIDPRRATRRLALVAVGCALAATGCASHTLTPADPTVEQARTAQPRWFPSPDFDYPYEEIPFDNHTVGRGATDHYTERQLTVPSYGLGDRHDGKIRARYLRSELPGPKPLVIVLPIYARYTYPSRKLAGFLQRNSNGAVHVLDVEGKEFILDWTRLTETDDEEDFIETARRGVERERETVIDIRRLIDWAEQRPEIDADRVALIGFSRSAMVAGLAATQEPRLAATVLMMGGAHPHRIIARCDGRRSSLVRNNVREQFGWDTEELEERLGELFAEVDAASFPGRVDPATVLVFEANRDECIPQSSRQDLKRTMGWPRTYTLDRKHRQAFIGITPLGGKWIFHRTWEFLSERFGLVPP